MKVLINILFVLILHISCVYGMDRFIIHNFDNMESDSIDHLSHEIAKFAIETKSDQIPDAAFRAAKVAMMDALGCAFAGHDATGVSEITEITKYWGGKEESVIWFDGTRVPAHDASFVNSVQLHAMDYDDYHPPSDCHITSILVPVVLAIGETTGASGEDVLSALIIGAEIIGRLGTAYKKRRVHPGFLPTSIIGGFGATAVACRLKNLSIEETVDALGIWYAHASGNRQALFDRTLTKRIQPGIAARASVYSASLSSIKITGPSRIIGSQPASLTQIYGCDPNLEPPGLVEIMSKMDKWVIEELHYKNYAACGYSDMPIETAISLSTKYNLVLSDIKEIRLYGDNVKSPFAGVIWEDNPNPQVLAQFCAPYAAASALKNQKFGPEEISIKKINADEDIDSLARRTKILSWKEWAGKRPDEPFAMQIELIDGSTLTQMSRGNERYKWPENYDSLISKFKENIIYSGLIDEEKIGFLIDSINKMEQYSNIKDFVYRWLI